MKQLFTFILMSIYLSATSQTFELVKDIFPGSGNSRPHSLTFYSNKLYFTAGSPNTEEQLWVSNGTEAGTYMLKNINDSINSYPYAYTVLNNKLYFHAFNASTGTELWVSDGTEAGTHILKDIVPGTEGSIFLIQQIIKTNSHIFFSTLSGQLWASDGTMAGTIMVQEFNASSLVLYINSTAILNDRIFFEGNDDVYGTELWVSDGTQSGTYMVKDIASGSGGSSINGLTTFNNKVYFGANGDDNNGDELWVTDGTESGTHIVKDIVPGTASSYPYNFIEYNNKLYFTVSNNNGDDELWVTDGTENGTYFFMDIDPTHSRFYIHKSIIYNNKLYFFVRNYDTGGSYANNSNQLWVTDGTVSGSYPLKEFSHDDWYSSRILDIIIYNNKIYFGANGDDNGHELWESDGTSDGTIKLAPNSSTTYEPLDPNDEMYDFNFQILNGSLYFPANYYNNGYELWKFTTETTAINTIDKSITFNVYPNPTSSLLNITCEEKIDKIEIMDLVGKVVLEQNLNTSQVNIENLPNGIYLLKVYAHKGISSKKIIKK